MTTTTAKHTTPAERVIASCQDGIIRSMMEFVSLLLFIGALFIWLA